MANQSTDKNPNDHQEQDSAIKPDPETLHTTDPEKKMEGPVSSLMDKLGKVFDNDVSKQEADKERDKNM